MHKTPKKIGIIGGAGPFASSLLYEQLIRECYQLGCKNESELPEIIIINYPFHIDMSKRIDHTGKPIICSILHNLLLQLEDNGAQLLAIACNTFHLFVPELYLQSEKFVHIVHTTITHAKQQGIARLLVLGTPLTLQSNLYHSPQMTVLTPQVHEQKVVVDIINRILSGSILKKDAATVSQIIAHMHNKGTFEGVILGCTELSVLHHHFPIVTTTGGHPVFIFDTVQLLAKRLAEKSLCGDGMSDGA